MRRVLLLAAALLALGAGQAAAGDTFRLPNKAIGCLFLPAEGKFPASLRCDVRTGLQPEPKRACELDWTGVWLPAKSAASAECAGDTAIDPKSPILAFGKTWTRGPFTCRSSQYGLNCSSTSRHGFFLSRLRWRVF